MCVSTPLIVSGWARFVTIALISIAPRVVLTRTRSPARTPIFAASCSEISMNGSLTSSLRYGMLRVIVPEHQCSVRLDVQRT